MKLCRPVSHSSSSSNSTVPTLVPATLGVGTVVIPAVVAAECAWPSLAAVFSSPTPCPPITVPVIETYLFATASRDWRYSVLFWSW